MPLISCNTNQTKFHTVCENKHVFLPNSKITYWGISICVAPTIYHKTEICASTLFCFSRIGFVRIADKYDFRHKDINRQSRFSEDAACCNPQRCLYKKKEYLSARTRPQRRLGLLRVQLVAPLTNLNIFLLLLDN